MKAFIVYESMYGNTRTIAHAIGEGLRPTVDVTVVSTAQASQDLVRDADLVVVGGPTHVHSLSRPATRRSAIDAAHNSGRGLTLDPFADRPGIREWMDGLGYSYGPPAAAFDTRMSGPALFTGRASKAITRLLRRHDFIVIARPESFLVTRDNKLHQGQTIQAQEWGASLAARLATERVHRW
jgi:flavodoxin-like protein